jgi:hypothetical protein
MEIGIMVIADIAELPASSTKYYYTLTVLGRPRFLLLLFFPLIVPSG